MEYNEFIKNKEVIAKETGFEISKEELNQNLFEFQKDIVRWALIKGRAAIFADTGHGKGQPIGSKVLTPYGWKEIQNLKIGDEIISSNGKSNNVIGVYPKEEIDTYRFYYSDGTECVFDIDHLHIVKTHNDKNRNKEWRVMSTKELLKCNNLRWGKNKEGRNYCIPVVEPINFNINEEIYISPYILGVLIGDGHLKGNCSLASNDLEIIERVKNELPEGVILEKNIYKEYDYTIKTGNTGNIRHKFREELIELGLYNKCSYEKFIPKKYLFASINERLELLRGLMDTDGYIRDTSVFYTTSKKLANDVMFLVQSLGGIPRLSSKIGKYKKENGEIKECKKCYLVTFSLTNYNPFYLTRKADKWKNKSRLNSRWIDRIEYEKKQKTVCIAVDSKDHSYVTENCIVTHNTIMQLEWANQVYKRTKGKILILAPLAVTNQTKKEGEKFGINVNVCETQEDVTEGINITNYEKLDKFISSEFEAIVLDESSILKSFTGKIRNDLVDRFRNTPYKLACTATPSPNDYMELGNHSEFLGVMTRNEMLAMYFIHDGGETSKWRLKGHAQDVFWNWMTSWAVVVCNPRDLGYEIEGYNLPKLNVTQIVADGDEVITESLSLTERRKARKESLEERCQAAAKLVNESDEQWVIWCDLNDESKRLKELINDSVEVKGSDKNKHKIDSAINFQEGNIKALVSKPLIFGMGLNFQKCHNMIFVGLSDSYELYYQAVRRCWRFGQKNEVNVYLVIGKREGAVKENIERKEKEFKHMQEKMIALTKDIVSNEIKSTCRISTPYKNDTEMKLPLWEEFTKEIKEDNRREIIYPKWFRRK